MTDNNNNPQTNLENAEDNTKNTIQEEGQKTTQEVVKTPVSNPEPKAESTKQPKKEDSLLKIKDKAIEKVTNEREGLAKRLEELESKFELTKKTAEVKEVLYNSDINPELTDLVMDKLLKSDDPQAELKTLLESKPSLKKVDNSKKPMFPSSSSGGGNPKNLNDMSFSEYVSTRNK